MVLGAETRPRFGVLQFSAASFWMGFLVHRHDNDGRNEESVNSLQHDILRGRSDWGLRRCWRPCSKGSELYSEFLAQRAFFSRARGFISRAVIRLEDT